MSFESALILIVDTNMWFFVVFNAIFISLLGAAHGIDFSTVFGTFKNATITNKIVATQCTVFKNRRRCKSNTNSVALDAGGTIELVVKSGGRKITCKNELMKGFGKWYGSCDGDADDANFLKKVDKNGNEILFGSIHVGNEICQIAPNLKGQTEIICTPESAFKAEDVPNEAPKKDYPHELRNLRFGFTPKFNETDKRRALFDDSGANIDVMVVWTKDAECRRSGLPVGCTLNSATEVNMRGHIDLAVSETNTAYALSGILTSLRLVHAYRDPDYIDSASIDNSLDHLTDPGDGFLDSVHVKRALYGADIVHMLIGR